MEDKKLLNTEEFEKVSGGGFKPIDVCRLYCMNCHTYIKEDVLWEMAEESKKLYELTHDCPSGKGPCIFIESYTR